MGVWDLSVPEDKFLLVHYSSRMDMRQPGDTFEFLGVSCFSHFLPLEDVEKWLLEKYKMRVSRISDFDQSVLKEMWNQLVECDVRQ